MFHTQCCSLSPLHIECVQADTGLAAQQVRTIWVWIFFVKMSLVFSAIFWIPALDTSFFYGLRLLEKQTHIAFHLPHVYFHLIAMHFHWSRVSKANAILRNVRTWSKLHTQSLREKHAFVASTLTGLKNRYTALYMAALDTDSEKALRWAKALHNILGWEVPLLFGREQQRPKENAFTLPAPPLPAAMRVCMLTHPNETYWGIETLGQHAF